ncbi:EAL domain-containing protein [Robertmurraya yapensis]|uniref:EAL domain-containing protein n=2 Tax=Bacillaceae TaxID=186817 RepID=A0A3S0KX26_9BACI|nr:EAL domain-containing protein [Bacillus yapensis]RTR36287.1 EAL domain-containing protein [Bacillus yapensis]TKT05790.1 EAL domain-containing protein [Bacillus yapensis]
MGLLNLLSNKKDTTPEVIEEFYTLFSDYPEAMFITNMDGEMITFNQRVTSLLGYKKQDTELLVSNFFQSTKSEKVRHHFHKATQGNKTSFEIAISHKSGKKIPLHITFIPSENHIFVICKNLTTVKSKETRLAQISEQLEESQKMTNIGTWAYDIGSDSPYWSKQMYEIMGVQKGDDFNWESMLKRIHPDDRVIYSENYQKSIDEKKDVDFEHRIIRTDGQERLVFVRTNVILDEEGEVCCTFGTVQDITKKRELESKLHETEKRFKSISDRLAVGTWSYDYVGNEIVFCSKGMEEIYGFSAERFKENPLLWKEFIIPEDRKMVEDKQLLLVNGEEIHFQFRIVDRNGEFKWLEGQTIPGLDKDGKLIRYDGIVRDVTERMNYIESLAFIADHDYLTNLPNRRYAERKLKELIETAANTNVKFAVFNLNLDRFKYINDTLGQEIGDKFLVNFADRMRKYLGSDTFFARIGGDEFTIIMKNIISLENAIKMANEIIYEIEKPFYIEDFELYVTTSIGISTYPTDGKDPHTLIKNADTALYKAKEAGRNDWQIFSPSMNVESFKLYHLEKDLRKSIMNEELYVHYQPKVNPKTSKLVGAEALVRWNHPEWGIVSPGEFIHLAEENGFIFKIGDWVLKEVCETLARWKKIGLPVVPVSVNVSPKRLLKRDFVKTVQQTIHEAGIDPRLIELELTEQTIIKNTEVTKNIITELKALGVKIALDDFGTGYSSLSYLKDLDIDTLKIDKSFIDGITVENTNDAIVKSLIFLSKEININIVAEGVETKEQLNFLLQQECQQIQGYIYSKPVSATRFESLLKKDVIKPLQTSAINEAIENRRKYFRVKLDCPLTADMTIIKFKNKDVKLGSSKAIIEDMSIGGLKYVSNINLPIRNDMLIQFNTMIFGKEVQFVGKNAWKFEIDGLYEYGFEFTFNEVDRDRFAPIFNKIVLQLKESSVLPDTSILQENRLVYLGG